MKSLELPDKKQAWNFLYKNQAWNFLYMKHELDRRNNKNCASIKAMMRFSSKGTKVTKENCAKTIRPDWIRLDKNIKTRMN